MLQYLGIGTTAETVYRTMLVHPGWGVTDLADGLGLSTDDIRSALDELFELDLLRESAEQEGALRPISPRLGLQSLLARQQADLVLRQQRIAESQATIAAMVAELSAHAPEPATAEVRQILGMDAILQRLERLSTETRTEALSIMPGVQDEVTVRAGHRNNAELLARGVNIRTIMQNAARNDALTLAYSQRLTDAGAEVRTAALLPPRMLILDRLTAIVPVDPNETRNGVLELTGPGVVTALVSLFEQVWQEAVPLSAAHVRDREGLTSQERGLLRLLGEGHTDESAAKRLSISERSCRRMMASLMDRLGARSRFEAGLLAAKNGWL